MMRACTIIARNYWAHARVLAQTLRAHHPDARLSVLVVDADAATPAVGQREAFDVLTPQDIGIDRREFHRMAAIYDLLELATAVKPWLLRHLIDKHAAPVVYLDPDIEVFSPLDEAWELAAEHGIVVTPHAVEPPPVEADGPSDELYILGSGTYNLGFIAVGQRGRSFLDWWADRLRRDGLIEKQAAMFVDQRWVDLVPSYFDVHIQRGPGWNVAYWNLSQRSLSRSPGGYEVNGQPLRFFHYSGFSPVEPTLLSCYEAKTKRTSLDDHPVLAELCSRYADRLMDNGYRAYSRIPHGFARTASGLPLDRYARRTYRRALLDAESSGNRSSVPDPFDARGARDYEDWLRAPAAAHRVTRYLFGLWQERTDLRALFPDLHGPEARFYLDWARSLGRFEPNVAPELIALETHRRRDPTPSGVNLAGYVRAESGVGEVSRLLLATLDAGGVPATVVPFAKTPSRQESAPPRDRGAARHETNVICVNADALPGFADEMGEGFFACRRNIGVWQWEVERFPESMASSAELLDEIWVASAHAARAVREKTTKPVYVFPLPIIRPQAAKMSRRALGLPDGFVFLFCFDFDSVFKRKNPLAVVEAFSRAFAPGSGPQLVIKSVRGEAHPTELDRLRAAANPRPDVHVRDGYLARAEHDAWMASCDAYVSLHRSEGFGLTMAEAMALAKPVVATGYSGNLEFMDVTNSWLVPYELQEIPVGCDPYPAGARWAEPDVDVAAWMMRQIVDDPTEACERGRRAAADVARLHAPAVRASFVLDRLAYVPEPPELERLRLKLQRPWTSVRSADKAATTGPDVSSPTSYGVASRLVRRLVYRVARHYIEHQENITSGLLDGVQDLDARLRTEVDAARNLEAKVHELSERLAYETMHRESLESRLVTPADPDLASEYPVGRVQRVRSYAGLFGSQAPVLAVGREATALIDLLANQGVNGFALDSGAETGGFSGVLSGMEGLPDRSLGGIFTVRVVEHLSADELQSFLELSRRKLASGGVLVAETEDARGGRSIEHEAMAPRALLELCRSTGFEQAYVLFPSGASSTDDEPDHRDFAIVASVLVSSRS